MMPIQVSEETDDMLVECYRYVAQAVTQMIEQNSASDNTQMAVHACKELSDFTRTREPISELAAKCLVTVILYTYPPTPFRLRMSELISFAFQGNGTIPHHPHQVVGFDATLETSDLEVPRLMLFLCDCSCGKDYAVAMLHRCEDEPTEIIKSACQIVHHYCCRSSLIKFQPPTSRGVPSELINEAAWKSLASVRELGFEPIGPVIFNGPRVELSDVV